ncbi:golgin subfamily B member 1-like isoform X2 [Limulus polyphemus]|uniref:Golgin subfamily B member 1-like isoform X2 n=1 Tax=Limulus polyphemus TaxID=6850 RepID=A0ABM1BML4_LIMPO|nr:golgin subfamily B member 1-like isoform X2 [Limulus polyphemus]
MEDVVHYPYKECIIHSSSRPAHGERQSLKVQFSDHVVIHTNPNHFSEEDKVSMTNTSTPLTTNSTVKNDGRDLQKSTHKSVIDREANSNLPELENVNYRDQNKEHYYTEDIVKVLDKNTSSTNTPSIPVREYKSLVKFELDKLLQLCDPVNRSYSEDSVNSTQKYILERKEIRHDKSPNHECDINKRSAEEECGKDLDMSRKLNRTLENFKNNMHNGNIPQPFSDSYLTSLMVTSSNNKYSLNRMSYLNANCSFSNVKETFFNQQLDSSGRNGKEARKVQLCQSEKETTGGNQPVVFSDNVCTGHRTENPEGKTSNLIKYPLLLDEVISKQSILKHYPKPFSSEMCDMNSLKQKLENETAEMPLLPIENDQYSPTDNATVARNEENDTSSAFSKASVSCERKPVASKYKSLLSNFEVPKHSQLSVENSSYEPKSLSIDEARLSLLTEQMNDKSKSKPNSSPSLEHSDIGDVTKERSRGVKRHVNKLDVRDSSGFFTSFSTSDFHSAMESFGRSFSSPCTSGSPSTYTEPRSVEDYEHLVSVLKVEIHRLEIQLEHAIKSLLRIRQESQAIVEKIQDEKYYFELTLCKEDEIKSLRKELSKVLEQQAHFKTKEKKTRNNEPMRELYEKLDNEHATETELEKKLKAQQLQLEEVKRNTEYVTKEFQIKLEKMFEENARKDMMLRAMENKLSVLNAENQQHLRKQNTVVGQDRLETSIDNHNGNFCALDGTSKQHQLKCLKTEMEYIQEELNQRTRRCEELRRTGQYWKEEVASLRQELAKLNKENYSLYTFAERLRNFVESQIYNGGKFVEELGKVQSKDDLNAEIGEETMAEVFKARNSLQTQLCEMEGKLNKLTEQLKDFATEKHILEAEIEKQKTAQEVANQELKTFKEKKKQEEKVLTQEIETAKMEMKQVNEELKQCKTDLENKDVLVKDLLHKSEGFENQSYSLHAWMGAEINNILRLEEKIATLSKENKEICAQNKKLTSELDVSNNDLEQERSQNSKKFSESKKIHQDEIRRLKEYIEKIECDLLKAVTDRTSLQKTVKHTQESFEEFQSNICHLEFKLGSVQKQLIEKTAAYNASKSWCDDLQMKVKNLQEDKSNLDTSVKKLKLKVAELEDCWKSAEQELSDIKREKEDFEISSVTQDKQILTFQHQVHDLKEQLSLKKTEYKNKKDKLIAIWRERETELIDKIEELNARIECGNTQSHQLAAEVKDLRSRWTKVTQENATLHSVLKEFEHKLSIAQLELKETKEKLKTENQLVSVLNFKNNQLEEEIERMREVQNSSGYTSKNDSSEDSSPLKDWSTRVEGLIVSQLKTYFNNNSKNLKSEQVTDFAHRTAEMLRMDLLKSENSRLKASLFNSKKKDGEISRKEAWVRQPVSTSDVEEEINKSLLRAHLHLYKSNQGSGNVPALTAFDILRASTPDSFHVSRQAHSSKYPETSSQNSMLPERECDVQSHSKSQ